jgi:alpha-galactosidase
MVPPGGTLILSGDITRLDEFTLSLLTNDEVIDVDQDALGHTAHRVAINGPLEVWARPLEDGSHAVGLFNRGDQEAAVSARWTDIGIKGNRIVPDPWCQKDLGRYKDEFARMEWYWFE